MRVGQPGSGQEDPGGVRIVLQGRWTEKYENLGVRGH